METRQRGRGRGACRNSFNSGVRCSAGREADTRNLTSRCAHARCATCPPTPRGLFTPFPYRHRQPGPTYSLSVSVTRVVSTPGSGRPIVPDGLNSWRWYYYRLEDPVRPPERRRAEADTVGGRALRIRLHVGRPGWLRTVLGVWRRGGSSADRRWSAIFGANSG